MAAVIPVEHSDFIDVLERVLTKGVVFEVEEDTDASAADRDASEWFHISIAGVKVFRIVAGVLWRILVDDEEESELITRDYLAWSRAPSPARSDPPIAVLRGDTIPTSLETRMQEKDSSSFRKRTKSCRILRDDGNTIG